MNTANIESSFEPYVYSITEQIEQHLSGLAELTKIAKDRPLNFNEKSAVERSIQVLVEVAIGCSKHFLKSKDKPVPSEARVSIERVYEILSLTKPNITEMRGAVGMRNAIIHDYLNLDWNKIDIVLKEERYCAIAVYIKKVCVKLLES